MSNFTHFTLAFPVVHFPRFENQPFFSVLGFSVFLPVFFMLPGKGHGFVHLEFHGHFHRGDSTKRKKAMLLLPCLPLSVHFRPSPFLFSLFDLPWSHPCLTCEGSRDRSRTPHTLPVLSPEPICLLISFLCSQPASQTPNQSLSLLEGSWIRPPSISNFTHTGHSLLLFLAFSPASLLSAAFCIACLSFALTFLFIPGKVHGFAHDQFRIPHRLYMYDTERRQRAYREERN